MVAELGPPAKIAGGRDRLAELIAAGLARLPIEDGNPLADWPTIRLPAGTVATLLNTDRDEA